MRLKEIATVRTGLVLSRKKAMKHDEVSYAYRQITLKSFSDSITLESQYFDNFLSNEKIDETYISRVGDIVVRLRKPNTAVYIDERSEGLIISSLMAIIRVHEEGIENAFLAQYLNTRYVKKMLTKAVKGTTIAMIKTKDLESLLITLPPLGVQNTMLKYIALSYKEIQVLEKLKVEKKKLIDELLERILL